MPLYYFELEGPGWSRFEDDEGIELISDIKALAYAHSMILESPRYLLVKDSTRKTFFGLV